MQLFSETIESIGRKCFPRGNKPVFFESNDSVYIVSCGTVDIFAVELSQGIPAGSRRHLYRLGEGELFIGPESVTKTDSIGFVMVGNPDSIVIELSKVQFVKLLNDKLHSEHVIAMLEKWVNCLVYNTFCPLQAMEYIEFTSGDNILLQAGKQVMSKHKMMWITCQQGQLSICGDESIFIDAGKLFPISDLLYLRAFSNAEIQIRSTKEILESSGLWHALQCLYEVIKEKIKLEQIQYQLRSKERLDRRAELKEINLRKGVFKLINILQSKEKRENIDQIVEKDLVLATCQLIGNRLGMRFEVPVLSQAGSNDKERLFEIARVSRVKIRKVLLEVNWWHYDNGPLFAFSKDTGNPIALIPQKATQYTFIDLTTKSKGEVNGEYASTLEEFGYFFYRPFPERALNWRDLIRYGIFRNSWDFVVVIMVGILGALLGLFTPYLTGKLFDYVIPSASINLLQQMVIALVSCTIAISIFELTRAIAMLRFEGKLDRDLQAALWDRLLSLPVPFFKQFTSGDLANRSLGINSMRQLLSTVAVQSILTGIFSVFYCVQLFFYDFYLSLIALGLGLIILIITLIIGYIYLRYQQPVLEIEGQISGMVLQFINGVSKLRTSGSEDHAFQLWAERFSEKKRKAFKAGLTQNWLKTINSMFPILASMVIFSFIVYVMKDKTFSVGDFAAYSSAYANFQNAMLQMAIFITMSLSIAPIYSRLKPILSQIPEIDDSKAKPNELNGNVNIYNLNFRYDQDGPLIIQDLSMEIQSGEFIAIVGQSGCGKSTLIRLLLGFDMPESGAIEFDGQDLANFDLAEIRKQMGVVLQHSDITQGSIFENIIGSSNLTLDDAWHAAEMAGVANDIKDMPMQMQTVLPFGGGTLSGGQRQRILIARALIRRPRIIIFDEATSALDNKTQKIVQESLDSLNATRIIIAHRLSTIKNADRIFFIEKGHVAEQGTFTELMKQNGLFANLAKRQMI